MDSIQSQSKSKQVILLDIDKLILKFIKEAKDPEWPTQHWRVNKVGRPMLPGFKA